MPGDNTKKDIRSMLVNEIADDFKNEGLPNFRAKQVYSWLSRGAISFDEMTDLSKDLRSTLKEKYCIACPKIIKKLVSAVDGTVKYLFEFDDGARVESVVMQYRYGKTICLSTQAGCKMGCVFCATGKGGFLRDLTAGEMLSQIIAASNDLHCKIQNAVLMGMGEPLDNFDNVSRFLMLATDEQGMNMSSRKITLSTCGLVDKIMPLCDVNDQITLSISLHAPNDDIRRKIMPIARKVSFNELMETCKKYIKRTNKRITFEYTMIDGVNDSNACAVQLAERLKGMLCHVNLIPVNAVKGCDKQASSKQRIKSFFDILNNAGVSATVRRTLGSDINASCGQLKTKEDSEVQKTR